MTVPPPPPHPPSSSSFAFLHHRCLPRLPSPGNLWHVWTIQSPNNPHGHVSQPCSSWIGTRSDSNLMRVPVEKLHSPGFLSSPKWTSPFSPSFPASTVLSLCRRHHQIPREKSQKPPTTSVVTSAKQQQHQRHKQRNQLRMEVNLRSQFVTADAISARHGIVEAFQRIGEAFQRIGEASLDAGEAFLRVDPHPTSNIVNGNSSDRERFEEIWSSSVINVCRFSERYLDRRNRPYKFPSVGPKAFLSPSPDYQPLHPNPPQSDPNYNWQF